jgi:rhodanese-related sulfurtransferase
MQSCGQASVKTPDRYPLGMDPDYTPQQVAELLASSEIQLIDVREPHEHTAGRIAGDKHIELVELRERAAEIDRDVPVVFYCRSGSRSAMAAQAFLAAGFDAHNLDGGLLAWKGNGLPMEPSDGFVAEP